MKLRRAAALALMGWYLVLLPLKHRDRNAICQFFEYDTLAACMTALSNDAGWILSDPDLKQRLKPACLSAVDPLLKGKEPDACFYAN
jgi:hypothetical protein